MHNPYSNKDILVPRDHHDFVKGLVDGGSLGLEEAPFDRMIDVWFLAFCLGARLNQRKRITDGVKIITGEILNRDFYRVELIELVAIAKEGGVTALQDSDTVIKMANEFAAGGLETLRTYVRGNDKLIWNLMEKLKEEFFESRCEHK